jgi:hypothetical protein
MVTNIFHNYTGTKKKMLRKNSTITQNMKIKITIKEEKKF